MATRIFPNWEQINNFKDPLTEGELALAKFLDENLPPKWEIYVQPFLNGDRPDLVILNPSIGIMIFEVKDWNLNLYHFEEKWYVDKATRQQRKGKKYFVTDGRGTYSIPSPVSQVERYRENLLNLYLPQIGDAIDTNSKNLSAFKVGLYFHRATTEQAKSFIPSSEKKCTVIGRDALHNKMLVTVVPDVDRKYSMSMRQDWAEDIRFWLRPPFHSIEQGQKLKLTSEQKRHIKPSLGQHQRLRGVAGSGKTLVLAQRAANLASQGKKVLVVTYNITLWHYIRDHISRARFDFKWDRIEFRHFHGFCSNFLKENKIEWPSNVPQDELFDKIVPSLVLTTVKSGKNEKNRRYDAILIDEGQDFQKTYYDTLCAFLGANDELLLVADERQNIYRRELTWLNSMEGTKFRGRWRELKNCYRIPAPMLEQVNKFAEQFLPNVGLVPVPQFDQLGFFDPHLAWREVDSFELAKDKIWQTVNWLTKNQSIHPQDIIVLVPTHFEGWQLVEYFKQHKIQVNHVFEDENKSHQHKKAFWMGDSRMKMSTIHSFKGWELLNVIILTPPDGHRLESQMDYLLYIAITRARQNIIVFNRNSKYRQYGQNWTRTW